MKFTNTEGRIIEGRLPKKEDNFSPDRYYTNVDNVFIRIDPGSRFILMSFPSISDYILKINNYVMEKLAKKNPSILELILFSDNVQAISKDYSKGYLYFSDDFDFYVKFSEVINLPY